MERNSFKIKKRFTIKINKHFLFLLQLKFLLFKKSLRCHCLQRESVAPNLILKYGGRHRERWVDGQYGHKQNRP